MRPKRPWLVADVLVVEATGALRGSPRQNQRTFRAQTGLVLVTATVLDRDGWALEPATTFQAAAELVSLGCNVAHKMRLFPGESRSATCLQLAA